MTLRLTGEEYSVVRGIDGQGYLREIEAKDADPGLLVNQQGTGPILSLRDGGVVRLLQLDGGKVLLANAASPPSSPDSLLHLWSGSSGDVDAPAGTLLTLEGGSSNTYLDILAQGGVETGVLFGDTGGGNIGRIIYNHNGDRFDFWTGPTSTRRLRYSAGAFAFQEETTISTTGGDLALSPAGNVKFGAHSAIGAETVTGYITIKDSGGASRKLAVVS